MSIRSGFRRAVIEVDSRLGVRAWLREDGQNQQGEAPRTSDAFALSEYQHPRPNMVLDVGGSHGQFAREALRAFPGVTIHSFEPIPECFEELRALAQENPTLHPINIALSDHSGTSELWLSAYRDSSSLNEMLPAHVEAWPHTKIEGQLTVQTARLDDVAKELELTEPIFAKLDVQGHELSVIAGGRATLARCQRVMIECNFAPLYKNQPTFNDLYETFRSMGFQFEGFMTPLRHPTTFELISADAIFFRAQ